MKTTYSLKDLIEQTLVHFNAIAEKEWSLKPTPNKWSKKEILGHLIDSAHNNLRRFIVTQYDQNNKIIYLQDDWVKLNDYHQVDFKELIQLWKLLNLQIARIIDHIPPENRNYTCDTGKQGGDLKTLEFLAEDYVVHMQHHLRAIFV